MFEARKDFAFVVERDEERLERAPRSAIRREQVIGVATLRAAPYHFKTFPLRYVLRAATGLAHVAEQVGQRRAECGGQRTEGFQARRDVAVLEAAQHRGADVR